MPKPAFEIIIHRGERRIKVIFENNAKWNARMIHVPGAKWSKTLKSWHIPDTKENRQRCKLPGDELAVQVLPVKAPLATGKAALLYISRANKMQMQKFIEHLQLKAYSPSTITTYRNEFAQLLQLLRELPVENLEPEHIRRYMLWCVRKGLKENTMHSRMNALKCYFEQVLHREKMFFDIPRPKRPIQLPKVLNETELAKMFNALTNKKHKAILFTAYSAGLRVSEVANLKLADIDSRRMQIHICRAKGKKDRYVHLSPVLLDILRQYLRMCKPRPKEYLFESSQTQSAYPHRTLQQIFSNAKRSAGIRKEVGIHSLRHSFATHLLEKGTDIRYIKEILGHFNIRTTERYLHVSKKQLVNVVSPFDDLWKSENIEW